MKKTDISTSPKSPQYDVEIFINSGVKVRFLEQKQQETNVAYGTFSPLFLTVPNNSPSENIRILQVVPQKQESESEMGLNQGKEVVIEEQEAVESSCCGCFRNRK